MPRSRRSWWSPRGPSTIMSRRSCRSSAQRHAGRRPGSRERWESVQRTSGGQRRQRLVQRREHIELIPHGGAVLEQEGEQVLEVPFIGRDPVGGCEETVG